MSKFLMNTWYMGAWGHELTDAPLSRRLLDAPVVFYRLRDGSVTALRDRCPHRFAHLSKGRVADDNIQCPYHGLVFGPTGRCVEAPLADYVPSAAVQHFPVVERNNIVWYWPGDPAKADPDRIPDFSYLEDRTYRPVHGLTPVACHYEVETDNLMDLSHVNWVHPPFSGALTRSNSTYTARLEGDAIHSNWFTRGGENPPIYEYGSFPTKGGLIDQWIEMRWSQPGAMFLEIAITKTGEERSAGFTLASCHILTPETDHTTNYFWSASLPVSDQMPLDIFRTLVSHAFDNENKPMLEDVDSQMGGTDLLALHPLILPSDRGAVMARRTMAASIRKENEAAQDIDPQYAGASPATRELAEVAG